MTPANPRWQPRGLEALTVPVGEAGREVPLRGGTLIWFLSRWRQTLQPGHMTRNVSKMTAVCRQKMNGLGDWRPRRRRRHNNSRLRIQVTSVIKEGP